MTQRTCNIIMCCKGHDRYGYKADPVYSIKRYMGKECMYPWSEYTDGMIEDILLEALKDYIDGVKKPSFVIWSLQSVFATTSVSDRIVRMFSLVQVSDDNGYANGFTEELIKQSEEELK